MKLTFLALDEVLALHSDQLHRYGGRLGLRDVSLLQSALGVPAATFDGEFLHASLDEMAAAYLFHITQNHPFVDGNKRVGLAAALLFLWMNGVVVDADDAELTELVVGVAAGRVSKSEVAVFFGQNRRKSRRPRKG